MFQESFSFVWGRIRGYWYIGSQTISEPFRDSHILGQASLESLLLVSNGNRKAFPALNSGKVFNNTLIIPGKLS